MARKGNSEVKAGGTIVVSFSMRKELKPNLAVIADRLKLKSVSELLSAIATDVDESARALAPLAELQIARREEQAMLEKRRTELLANIGQLSGDQLAELFEKVVEIEEREETLKRPPAPRA